jgi:hypothetical protein
MAVRTVEPAPRVPIARMQDGNPCHGARPGEFGLSRVEVLHEVGIHFQNRDRAEGTWRHGLLRATSRLRLTPPVRYPASTPTGAVA